jgi:hypothetical protein
MSSTVAGMPGPLPAVEEVWFAGCHSDVGGGAVKDAVRYSLADISLRWMVKQVVISQCGIKFDATALRMADMDIATIVHVSPGQPGVEQVLKKSEPEDVAASPIAATSSGEDDSGDEMVGKGKGKDAAAQPWPQEQDVLTDIHDQLKIKPVWWLLETMPMKFTWQDPDGTWKSKWGYAHTNSTLWSNEPSLICVETLF